MFLVIPVENTPSWKSPPWVTILLIVCNILIFFGWQQGEDRAVYEAAAHYEETELPAIELPAFVAHLEARAKAKGDAQSKEIAETAQETLDEEDYKSLYVFMWQEHEFRRKLLAGEIIQPDAEQYAQWQSARRAFNAYEPEAFTTKWSQDYSLESFSDIFQNPITLLTSIFLHGGFGHLLGNMVFLFIFGFTLEKALKPTMYLLLYLLSGVGASTVAAWAYAGMGSYGLGASGAIAGLMAMYVVLYRLRKIKFFYFVVFYFSYATMPALIMLPVWMGYEVLQSFISDARVAYMAHFGGLLSGAILMGVWGMVRPLQLPSTDEMHEKTPAIPQQAELDAAIARAKKYAGKLEFDMASKAWRQAAKISPSDISILQSWFEVAQYSPEGNDFHTSARMIFQLRAADANTRQLQKNTYKIYIEKANPRVRLLPVHMLQLGHTFVALNNLHEAERLCRLLEKTAPKQKGFAGLVSALATAWARVEQPNKAKAWLNTLQQLSPNDPMVAWLQKM